MIARYVVRRGGDVVDENLGALAIGAERFFLNVWFETLTLGVDVVERGELGFDETFDVRAREFFVHDMFRRPAFAAWARVGVGVWQLLYF